ncbi:MAG TPA: hypothetical protein DEE98_06580 [Elusimicrobia bacterium]|nr:MAG: hypothetical protein A2278_06690 [Elusimicrobia bacterium RIFOXYA12_FULL_49_49]OGS10095.1 MAG: hypothetical protein A2204_06925 [Elusimicrobia bacterium RIFOXYA1_FULL_47_7]OGS16268.1 MAG: hypothetical protein A2251_01495 [Elusimicrobia bacterium RIFOXYA2_FULL_47_53]OGS26189.1 MAG: hypothetical protein A2339_02600 [Elusimicrobia bacterium RIFOXYB12_FULL_50_12]OGS31423.1 MAG: hypothetical protein A2323_09785 [Elusimicrobia bacterium RIFOXYB2_FULL_46_23]HBU70036.1 hypothetical protein [El
MIYLVIGLMILFALFAVVLHDVLMSVLSLAVVSTLLSILFFQLGAPVAGVLELSVGAGLITVLIVLTISFIQERREQGRKPKAVWVVFSVIISAALAYILYMLAPRASSVALLPARWSEVGEILWKTRSFDLFPQALVVLSAAFGILALLRSGKGEEK